MRAFRRREDEMMPDFSLRSGEDEQVRWKENVNKGEGLAQSRGTFVSVFLHFGKFFVHFQWQTEQRV